MSMLCLPCGPHFEQYLRQLLKSEGGENLGAEEALQ